MYSLILVDDEPFMLRGIPQVFDLKKYGFKLVKTYSNPLIALEELSETKPDLIITDIKMPQMDGLRFSREVKKIIQTFSNLAHIEEFYTDEYLYFLMYDFKNVIFEEEDLHKMIYQFAQKKASQYIHFLTGVSDIHRDISQISLASIECDDGILTNHKNHDYHTPKYNALYNENADLYIPSADIENFMIAISTHDALKLEQILDHIFDQPAIKLYKDVGTSITLMILLKMAHIQTKYQASENFITANILNIGYLSTQYSSTSLQKNLIMEKALKLSELIKSQEIKSSSKIILSAIQYINNNYNQNINLTDVANAIHISKNYLCDLFKKEMNITFIDYVTNLRIEKAKYLLSYTDKKMYEISEEVGYNDYAYFSQIFKRHTGTTLSTYRKQH